MKTPTQSIRPGVPLPEGFKPCVRCKDTRRAITEVYGFWKLNEHPYPGPFPNEPPYVGLKHWCDDGLPDEEWNDLVRYCHGHTGTTADIELEAKTRDELRAKWNARNTILSKPVFFDSVPLWMYFAALGVGVVVSFLLK